MEFNITRTQYFFDLSGVRCKSRADTLIMQRQWNIYEQVENYNDIVYQRIQAGYRDRLFYQFVNRQEISDYRTGQQLHILRYPWLPPCTFDSISNRPFPKTPAIVPAPIFITQDLPCGIPNNAISASEKTSQQSDMAIYTHVSSYNTEHTYKYIFTSNEEKMAYHRGEKQALTS